MTGTFATNSIRARLLGATLGILPIFLLITGLVLDRAFVDYQLETQSDRLRLQQQLLAKEVDWDGSRWQVASLDEAALSLLDSGLYAFILSPAGDVLWSSTSAQQIGELADALAEVVRMAREQQLYKLAVGESAFTECALDADYFCYSNGVAWGSDGPEGSFLIMESQNEILLARQDYRKSLALLCGAMVVLLLLAQAWVIAWGLLPLKSIAGDIRRLEEGKLDRLADDVPAELEPLTDSVNQLLASEQSRRERVRNTMDRLAHVLKTPLMVLRNSEEDGVSFRELVQEQVGRMLGVVEGELARARLDGRAPDILGKSVPVQPLLARIVNAYGRLPRMPGQGDIAIDTAGVAMDAAFSGDERDLQDLFGSILENSLKYCHSRIEIAADIETIEQQSWLVLGVGDDGEGIPDGYESEILRRGARADTANVGQGLGLSIVVEIVSAYGGSLHTDKSPMGGALFIVRLPGARMA